VRSEWHSSTYCRILKC